MAFVVKTVKVDIDIDLSKVTGIAESDKLIKPVKVPTAEQIIQWGKTVVKLKPEDGEDAAAVSKKLMEKYDNDISIITKEIVISIDFWYGKGEDWWAKRLDLTTILSIFSFLIDELFKVKKKKSTSKP